METKNKIQIIKDEIERLKNHTLNIQKSTDGFVTSVGRGRVEAFNDILKFIDSLPEEPASEDLDFQTFAEEMHTVFALPSSETKNTEEDPLNWEYAIARHFAEWQKEKDQEIDKLTESPDLDEASWKYSDRDGITYGQRYAMQIDFKAGAKWNKQQMMKNAVDATILDIDAQTVELGLWPEKLLDIKEGDKVKIIIIKENG